MLSITVDLLLGTMRADPTGNSHTGEAVLGEWPPAPLRLFSALVAGDGTRDRSRHTTGEELAFLEGCDPPAVFASPPSQVHHQKLHPRYVVEQTGKAVEGQHQEYPGRKGAQIRPGVRVAPRCTRVVYTWDEDPPAPVLAGLRARAARVGYLGTADSPVQVRVDDRVPDGDLGARYEPDPDGELLMGVPRSGVVAALDAHFDLWHEHGPAVTRTQAHGLRRMAAYRTPEQAPLEPDPSHFLVCVLDRSLPGRKVTSAVQTFKAALLDLYQRGGQEPPALLHGHASNDTDTSSACYLALNHVGRDHARGTIHGLALLLPSDTDADILARCEAALFRLEELHAPSWERQVHRRTRADRNHAVNPSRWRQASTHWATAFPALHERRRVTIDVSEVSRWCEHAGLPAPVAVRSTRSPLVAGGVDLAPSEVNRPDRPRLSYSHVELIFAEPVTGPVVIGAGRTRGLGLCVPIGGGS